MINYITKKQMLSRWGADYFGLTVEYYQGREPEIYIRNDLPKCVEESVLAHEQHHAKGNHGEFGAWIAGFKGNRKGFFLGILLSLRFSRLKIYPKFVAFSILAVSLISYLIYNY